MLEVGKTYIHSRDNETEFVITERFTDYFVGRMPESISGNEWLFDKNGTAIGVKGSESIRPHFSLKEKIVEEVVYVRVNNYGATSISKTPNFGTIVADIKLIYKDGIAISAELVKPNQEKAKTDNLITKTSY